MCLTARTSVAVSAGTGAAASLGFTFNVNAAPFVPSQSSGSEAKAAAQLPAGQKSNVHAPEFIPALSKAGAAAPPKFRWNVNAPEFIPYSQPALSQIFQVRLQADSTHYGQRMHALHAFLSRCICRGILPCWVHCDTTHGLNLLMCMPACNHCMMLH